MSLFLLLYQNLCGLANFSAKTGANYFGFKSYGIMKTPAQQLGITDKKVQFIMYN